MTITIKINTDNAAFEDDKATEVHRIVREAVAILNGDDYGPGAFPVRDSNGNTVGSVTVTGK